MNPDKLEITFLVIFGVGNLTIAYFTGSLLNLIIGSGLIFFLGEKTR